MDRSSWKQAKGRFFLPVRVLSRVFRGKFIEGLAVAFRQGRLCLSGDLQRLAASSQFRHLLAQLSRKEWVVYAKPPFGGAEHVLQYLARYTHRVAISNHRLLSFDGNHVSFRWKEYAHRNKQKKMTLAAGEFLRRFLLHVLPDGFVRIRHFGLLANRHRTAMIALCKRLITHQTPDLSVILTSTALTVNMWSCPRCSGPMTPVQRLSSIEASWYASGLRHLDSS